MLMQRNIRSQDAPAQGFAGNALRKAADAMQKFSVGANSLRIFLPTNCSHGREEASWKASDVCKPIYCLSLQFSLGSP